MTGNISDSAALPQNSGAKTQYGKWKAFCTCYILLVEYINYFVHTLLNLIGFKPPYVTQLVLAAGLMMLAFLFVFTKARSGGSLLFPVLVGLLYLLTYVRLSGNTHFFVSSVPEKLFLYCIPAYMAVYMLEDFDSFYEMLRKFCFFLLGVELLTVALMTAGSSAFVQTDYQGISYGLLIPLIFWICKEKRTKLETVGLAVAFFLMIFFGGRGPLVCVLLCVFYKMFIHAIKKPLWFVLLFAVSALLLYFYGDIIQWVISVSTRYGFSGSIVKYYQMGDIFMTGGRDLIKEYSRELISDHPIFGVGMGGTRYWLGVYGYKFGVYPHSILYEFWCDYGVILGTVLLGLLCVGIVRVFFKRKANPKAYALFEICVFSTGFLVLMFSSSYLFCPLFFAMLALMLRFSDKKQNSRLQSNL